MKHIFVSESIWSCVPGKKDATMHRNPSLDYNDILVYVLAATLSQTARSSHRPKTRTHSQETYPRRPAVFDLFRITTVIFSFHCNATASKN